MVDCIACYNSDCLHNIRSMNQCGIKDKEIYITKNGLCAESTTYDVIIKIIKEARNK